MKRSPRSLPPPGLLIAGIVAIALLIVGSAVFEVSSSRDDLLHVLRERSVTIAEAVDVSAANAAISNAEVERLLAQRLVAVGRSVAILDSLRLLTPSSLRALGALHDVDRINVFDRSGRRVMSSRTPEPGHEAFAARVRADTLLRPLLNGQTDPLIVGLRTPRSGEGMRFAVGIRRSDERGAIVLSLDAATLLQFRRRIGFGALVQTIGDNSGIAYVAFQDEEGIFAASRGVDSLSTFDADPALHAVALHRSPDTRVIDWKGRRAFEVLRPFVVEGSMLGVLRVAVDMTEFNALDARMVRRAVLVSLIVLLLSGLLIGVVLSAQRYRFVSRAYDSIQTYASTVVEGMPDALLTTDSAGVVTIANARSVSLFAGTGSPLVGCNLDSVGGAAFDPIRASLRDRQPLHETELGLTSTDGRTTVLSASTSFTFEPDGGLGTFTAVLRDVTRARALERALAQRERTMIAGELASTVAHEIRNPLNAIAMIAQRFDRTFTPRTRVREFRDIVATLKKETRRVNGIVEDFLRASRLPRSPKRTVDPAEMVRSVTRLAESQAAMKGVLIRTTVVADLRVEADADRMEQALLNLVRNALEAAPDGGTVAVSLGGRPGGVAIAVEDDGPGIPRELRNKVFQPYFTTKSRGTGLGLAIVRQTVEEHDGAVHVEDRTGGGARIVIELPLSERHDQPQ